MLPAILVSTLLSLAPASATIDDAVSSTAPSASQAPTTTIENVFLPDDTATNFTDCISSLPRPECGSKERGGWRQGAVFGVIVLGLIAIGTRLVIGIRRR